MKRALDLVVAVTALVALSPLLAMVALLTWAQDGHSPLYIAPRVGRGGVRFRMVKFRSMRVGADRSGVDSTAADDRRITAIGAFLRAYKLDELLQLWNVANGDMSLVGPRPQVKRDVDILTDVERGILSVRPGITDIASIVFSDEGEILRGMPDPDLAYNQLIRPWKSRFALLYAARVSISNDLRLIGLTALALVSKKKALAALQPLLESIGADATARRVALRVDPLVPYPPPGTDDIVRKR